LVPGARHLINAVAEDFQMGEIADDHYAEIRWNAKAGGTFGIMAESAMNRADKLGVIAHRRNACKFCGATGLHWARPTGKWMLADQYGKPHTCIKPPTE